MKNKQRLEIESEKTSENEETTLNIIDEILNNDDIIDVAHKK